MYVGEEGVGDLTIIRIILLLNLSILRCYLIIIILLLSYVRLVIR